MSFYLQLLETSRKNLNHGPDAHSIALFPHSKSCTPTHQITYIQNLSDEDQELYRLCPPALRAVLNAYSEQLANYLQVRHPNSLFIPTAGMVICKFPNGSLPKIEASKYEFEILRHALFGPSEVELTRTTSEQAAQPPLLPPVKLARRSTAPG